MELSGKISLIMSEIVLSVSTGTPDRGGAGGAGAPSCLSVGFYQS